MAFVEGYRSVCKFKSGPRSLAVIWRVAVVEGWPLRGVPLYVYIYLLVVLTYTTDNLSILTLSLLSDVLVWRH